MIRNSALHVERPAGRSCSVLGMRVDEVDYDSVADRVRRWALAGQSRAMCIANVHMVMETYDDPTFREIVNGADLVGADGVPVIKVSRWLGLSRQSRVFAPVLMVRLCRMAAAAEIPVGLYGSTPETIAALTRNLKQECPGLNVALAVSPPFRAPTAAELDATARQVADAGVRILFVGLGCPKQERWMRQMRGRIAAVMIGAGWGFDVIAGNSRTAPAWAQNMGLEWLFRLAENPRKLWRRHLVNNPRFIALVLLQLCGLRRYAAPPPPA
jgi:N-acetylglucosaminyldiphosphoundecaprenol N-acetyl-beta-D-mannosaminyltransferase